MNRNDEYRRLMQELDALPVPDGSLRRAKRRERIRKYAVRPLSAVAAVLVLFTALINLSSDVAYAAAQIPGLRELVRALTFSRSLQDAVRNEYVQPVGLTESDNDVQVTVDYLILDEKNLTVFCRVESGKYPHLAAEPDFSFSLQEPCLLGCSVNNPDARNGELRSFSLNVSDGSIPSPVIFRLKLKDLDQSAADAAENYTPVYVAQVEFTLEPDLSLAARTRHFEVGRDVEIGGYKLCVRSIDILPTSMSLNVTEDEANTSALAALNFYAVTDRGDRFDTPRKGVTAHGDTHGNKTYLVESPFFYDAKSVTLCFTRADWRRKDAEPVRVDLVSGTAENLPSATRFIGARREGDGCVVTVLQNLDARQAFWQFFGGDGAPCTLLSSSASVVPFTFPDLPVAPDGWVYEEYTLSDLSGDEVWLQPYVTDVWTAATPVEMKIELKETGKE